jgi:hypothetical protein
MEKGYLLKLFQEWEVGGRKIKENNGKSEFNYDIFDIWLRTFANITMNPYPAQQ